MAPVSTKYVLPGVMRARYPCNLPPSAVGTNPSLFVSFLCAPIIRLKFGLPWIFGLLDIEIP